MNDPLDRLEKHTSHMAEQITYEQQNRRGLLWIHAICGLTAGLQMLLWGSPPSLELAAGLWVRGVMAGLGLVGGALLAWGLSRRPRSVPFEAAGLTVVGLWDFLMFVGLGFARFQQHDFRIIPLNEPLPPGYVVAYATTIYLALFALISVHLYTLRKIRKAGRSM